MAFRIDIWHRLRAWSRGVRPLRTLPRLPARLPIRWPGLLTRARGHWALLKPDIPFSREDANQYLPWVVGLMVCLSGLFLAAALSIHHSSASSGRLNVNHFQVYIPHDTKSDVLTEQVRQALLSHPEIAGITTLQAADIADIIAPWTGQSLELDVLPLPLVLEVGIGDTDDRVALVTGITEQLQAINPAIEVESYQQWVEQLVQFTTMLRVLAFALACLILLGLTAMIVVAARTSLKLHFRTVQLLHHIGATDAYISRQFVINGIAMMLRGAIPGAAAAALLFLAVAFASSGLSSPLLPQIAVTGWHVLLFLVLPLFAAAAAYAAVRAAVHNMLEMMN